jgi:Ca2+-binding RTX toxin-like protein
MQRVLVRPLAAAASSSLEALETRRLLSTAVLSGDGVMTITGGAERNYFYVSFATGNKMTVRDNGQLIDSFDKGAVRKVIVNCGDGNDQVYLGSIGVPARIDGGAGDDNLYASDKSDTVLGGDGNDLLTGLDGNDSLDGGAGDDSISCGTGNDTVFAGEGNDRVWGHEGDDLVDGGFGRDLIQGGKGVDTVSYATRTNPVSVDMTGLGKGEQNDDGEAGELDFIDADNEILVGGRGDDVLIGNADPNGNFGTEFNPNNKIIGGEGNDTIRGLDGNDTLDGGAGADVLEGGDGIDVADYSRRAENLRISLDGVANDGAFSKKRGSERDNVGADVENVWGGGGSDLIVGDADDNVLSGGGGNDMIRGGDGNDTITGGAGLDQIFGEAGDDVLYANDLSLPRNVKGKKRQQLIARAKDRIDGGTGIDRAKWDLADAPPVGVEKRIK